jgi:hypothetical protein
MEAQIVNDEGKVLGQLAVARKDFKSGSKGFFGTGKVEIKGVRYQAQIQMVEIGSKGTKAGAITRTFVPPETFTADDISS